jgi:hypothetical protein
VRHADLATEELADDAVAAHDDERMTAVGGDDAVVGGNPIFEAN